MWRCALSGLLPLVLFGCAREKPSEARPISSETPTTSATPPVPAASSPPPRPEERWACSKDADCAMSCSQGAVSRDWYKTSFKGSECKDGCSSKGMNARCIDATCVGFDPSGDRADDCTHRVVD